MAFLPRFVRSTVLAGLGCGLLLMFSAPAALAHDSLKRSSPAKDARVESVQRIELEFSARVRFPVVVLHDANGRTVNVGKPEAQGKTVTAALSSPLGGGGYMIGWRVVSSDGHPIEGEIPFTVTGSAAPTPPSVSSSGGAPVPVSAVGEKEPDQGGPGWIWVAVAALVAVGAGVWFTSTRRDRTDDAS